MNDMFLVDWHLQFDDYIETHSFSRITLSLHYDNNFKGVVGKGSDNTAKRKIREIVNLAGPIFKSESWKLGHSITLEELEITHVNEDLTLEGGRESEAKM